MSQKITFTKETIDALPPAAEGKREFYYDRRVSGLQVQVTARGAKTYYVYKRVHGRPKRTKLGRHPDMTPAQAREQAKITIGKIASGEDPAELKRIELAETVTLEDAFQEFLLVRTLKPKTEYDYKKTIYRAFADWQEKQLKAITKDMIAKRHQKLTKDSGPSYANLAMRTFRSVYNFAAASYEDRNGDSLLPANPVQRISATRTWNRERPRDNYITEAQLPAWFAAVMAHRNLPQPATARTVADFLLLVLFTGLRNQEAATLRWEDVDLTNKTLTVLDTKNHEDHTLPLSDFLHQLLADRPKEEANTWVFPSERRESHLIEPRKQVAKIIQACGVQFTIHDLRRTFITYAERLDISVYSVKRLVNHKMRQDVTAGYTKVSEDRLRTHMQTITDFLLETGKVIPTIHGAKAEQEAGGGDDGQRRAFKGKT